MSDVYNPPNLQTLAQRIATDPSGIGRDVDQAVQVAYRKIDNVTDTVNGIISGSRSVTGSALRIATGLSSIQNVTVSIQSSTAINEWVSFTLGTGAAAGTFSIYVWKPTSSSDNTPIASTTARTIHWIVKGTP